MMLKGLAGSTKTALMMLPLLMSRSETSRKKDDFLAQRTAERAAEVPQKERGLLTGIRIARIEDIVAEIEIHVSSKLVRAGLGEDLDASEAEPVEFRRKRVLIDSNFADRILGRECSAVNPSM